MKIFGHASDHGSIRDLVVGRSASALATLRAGLARDREVTRFLIFAQGRTGSTLLTSSLDSHPEIRCADEILARPCGDPRAFVANRARICGARAFGFHVKCYQLSRVHGIDDWGGFLRQMSEDGWRIVYLWRQNLVRHVLSGLFAQASGRYHFRGTERRPEQLHIDPRQFEEWLGQRADFLERERAALEGLPYHELVYERDLADPDARARALGDLQRVLGIDPRPLATSLKRSVDRPLSSLIANHAELSRALAATPYAAQLG